MRKKTNVYQFVDSNYKKVYVTGKNKYEAAKKAPKKYREQITTSSMPYKRGATAKDLDKYREANKAAGKPLSRKEKVEVAKTKAKVGFIKARRTARNAIKNFDREGFSNFIRG